MSRMSATTLDLSRYPAPLALRVLDVEAVLEQRLQRLQELAQARGIAWDVGGLKANPFAILEHNDAYRELLTVAAINDAVRSIMVAFARGSDLDHLAAFYGVARRVITPATASTVQTLEDDAEFRRRVLLAPEAFAAAGPAGAYLFHALTADPRVLNADVWSPAPGEVTVAIQSREGDGLAPADLIAKVRQYLHQDAIKPLTDVVTVGSVTNHIFDVDLEAFVLPGPDAIAVKSAIEAAIGLVAAQRRTPARDMPRSALIAAAQIGVVDKVILAEPAGDLARDYGEVAVIGEVRVKVTTHAG